MNHPFCLVGLEINFSFPPPPLPHTKKQETGTAMGNKQILKQAETTLGKNEILKINPW